MVHQLTIHALGGLTFAYDDHPLTALRTRKDAALLLYLARTTRSHPRETLAELFWPERPQSQALSNLRRSLYTLQKAIGGLLIKTRYDCALAEGRYWLDASALEAALCTNITSQADAQTLEDALQLYQGDFLAGFGVESPDFDEWVLLEREHLRRRTVEALDALVRWHIRMGTYSQGLPWAHQLLDLDPLREVSHQHIMRLYAQTGNRTQALKQYDTCCQILHDELGVAVMPETSQLYDRLATNHETCTHNLPAPLTSFVGRQAQIEALYALLSDTNCRLLSLVALGGMGKTRLALELGWRCNRVFDRVCWVPLAGINHPDNIVFAIRNALNITNPNGTSAEIQVTVTLSRGHNLLILDNFEHLLPETGLVSRLLEAAPNLHIVITSREVPRIYGEWVREVDGLCLPTTSDDFAASAAVRLFTDSVRRVRPQFDPLAQQEAVHRLCHITQGMPLALEIAATWARTLSVDDIADRIALDLLQTDHTGIADRHRSIRAIFAQTWQQLTSKAKRTFARLGVFRGGFTLEAAQAVAGADANILAVLIDHGLVKPEDDSCYSMHELVRQFAEEKVEAPSELRSAYIDYFVSFMATREPMLKGGAQLDGITQIKRDLNNILTVWEYLVAQADIERLSHLAISLGIFRKVGDFSYQWRALYDNAFQQLNGTQNETPEWGRFLASVADLPYATNCLERAFHIALVSGDNWLTAFCYTRLADRALGHSEMLDRHRMSFALAQHGATLWKQLNDPFFQVQCWRHIADICIQSGDFQLAEDMSRQGTQLARSTGDWQNAGDCYRSLGATFSCESRFIQARGAFLKAIDCYERIGHCLSTYYVKGLFLACLETFVGNFDLALDYIEVAIHEADRVNMPNLRAFAETWLAYQAMLDEDYVRAASLAEGAYAILHPSTIANFNWLPRVTALYITGAHDQALSKAIGIFCTLRNGRYVPGYFLSLPIVAAVLAYQGQNELATKILSLAWNHPGSPHGFIHAWPIARNTLGCLQRKFDPREFDELWQAGKIYRLDKLDEYSKTHFPDYTPRPPNLVFMTTSVQVPDLLMDYSFL